jgi:enterochelin esterase family protein
VSLLERLESALAGGPAAIRAILGEVEFPHVEGRNVTFLFDGEADEITLHHWIHGLPGELQFRRLRRSSLWVLQIDLPRRSRMEYKIGVMRGSRGELVRDPLNSHLARDPFGANSVVYGEG